MGTVSVATPSGNTVTVTSSEDWSALSSPVSRRTYVPAVSKDTDVVGELGSVNVAVPGPLTCDHVRVTVPGGFGSPSSVTEPCIVAEFGSLTV